MLRRKGAQNRDAGYVKLNVGGKVFCTSLGTLMWGDTMLSAMFSERIPLKRDQDGAVFIDRDGKHFGTILNFLRDGNITKPNTKQEVQELRKEAEFFCIAGLSKYCENFLKEDEFGDDVVKVWSSVILPRTGSISTQGQPSMTVPLMVDGTMSLPFLRKIFKHATCLCVNKYNNGVGNPQMLTINGDTIYPPKEGWKSNDENRRYFVPPIYGNNELM